MPHVDNRCSRRGDVPECRKSVPRRGAKGDKWTVQLVAADQIRCIECSEEWRPDETTLWRAYLTEELPPELILYCPSCAKREFDE